MKGRMGKEDRKTWTFRHALTTFIIGEFPLYSRTESTMHHPILCRVLTEEKGKT